MVLQKKSIYLTGLYSHVSSILVTNPVPTASSKSATSANLDQKPPLGAMKRSSGFMMAPANSILKQLVDLYKGRSCQFRTL